MKNIVLAMGLLLPTLSWALPHLDLEMTSEEYRDFLKHQSQVKGRVEADPEIEYSLKLGNRLSLWIAKINEGRAPEAAIRLTSLATRRGVPIDKPNIYNVPIIKANLEGVLAEFPTSMKDVILAEGDLPGTTDLDDETFIKHARLLDKNYQNAARYKGLAPHMSYYAQAAAYDVRGYYYLKQNKITEVELTDVSAIPAEKVAPIKEALGKICQNSFAGDEAACAAEVEKSFAQNTVGGFYTMFYGYAEANWNEFFNIPENGTRKDVVWSNNTMTVPFNTPTIAKFIPYLQDNIQDEYRFGDWKLLLNFGIFADGPLLKFETGVVPHVNGLGGNEIVMDSNQPIEEYESKWTIRHEFGHVIGLPDCYHEFYDVKLGAFVNYQLDITDIMCSRAGDMKERIYDELKRVYGQK